VNPIIASPISRLPTAIASPVSPAPAGSSPELSGTTDAVDLSSLGRALSALSQGSQSGGTQDASSNYELPEEVQRLMEHIQELQQQLREKQQQLMQLMADTSQSQEAKQLELAEIQASIQVLTGHLMSAMTQLLQMMEASAEG